MVPCGAQTLGGEATGIVQADHFDVVGHFESERFRGTTVFKSGAGFDDERCDALRRAVAHEISGAEA